MPSACRYTVGQDRRINRVVRERVGERAGAVRLADPLRQPIIGEYVGRRVRVCGSHHTSCMTVVEPDTYGLKQGT